MEKSTRLSRASRRDCFVSRGNRQNIMKMCSTVDVPADRQAACIVGLSGSPSVCLSLCLPVCLPIYLSISLSVYISVYFSVCLPGILFSVLCFFCMLLQSIFLYFSICFSSAPCQSRLVRTHFHLPFALKIDQHFDGLNVKRLLESTDSHGPDNACGVI